MDLLQQLIDKSLVTAEQTDGGSARYFILESVWDYAREKLNVSGEAPEYCGRHLDYFMRFAAKAEPKLSGPEQVEWMEKVAVEDANIRLALEWSAESGEQVVSALRLASSVVRYWEVRSHYIEGREHFAALLARLPSDVPPEVHARALAGSGRLACCQDDDAMARIQ
jgi:predicted ATPase